MTNATSTTSNALSTTRGASVDCVSAFLLIMIMNRTMAVQSVATASIEVYVERGYELPDEVKASLIDSADTNSVLVAVSHTGNSPANSGCSAVNSPDRDAAITRFGTMRGRSKRGATASIEVYVERGYELPDEVKSLTDRLGGYQLGVLTGEPFHIRGNSHRKLRVLGNVNSPDRDAAITRFG